MVEEQLEESTCPEGTKIPRERKRTLVTSEPWTPMQSSRRKFLKILNMMIQSKILPLSAAVFSQSWPVILSNLWDAAYGDVCLRMGPAEAMSLEIGEVNRSNS